MKTIQDIAAFLFVTAVAILTAVCVLGVWEFFGHDIIWKSFQTVGLLAAVAVVVIIAGRFMGHGASPVLPSAPNPVFKSIRSVTPVVLIIAASLLAFIGVLAIWDVIADKEIFNKAIGSLAVLSFGTFVMVVTCMERENNPMLNHQKVSAGGVIGGLILLYLIFAFSGLFS